MHHVANDWPKSQTPFLIILFSNLLYIILQDCFLVRFSYVELHAFIVCQTSCGQSKMNESSALKFAWTQVLKTRNVKIPISIKHSS